MKKLLLLSIFLLTLNAHSQVADLTGFCGNMMFDLTSNTAALIVNENPNEVTVTFHHSQSDAQVNSNPITDPENYFMQMQPETIFARVENFVTATVNIRPFQLVLAPQMQVWIEQTLDFPTSELHAQVFDAIGNVTYTWQLDNVVLPDTTSLINILNNPPGTYTVTVTDEAGCAVSATILITSGCIYPAPATTVEQPTCANPNGSITVYDVPEGTTVIYTMNGGPIQSLSPQGNMATLTVPASDFQTFYSFYITGTCTSQPTNVVVNGISGSSLVISGVYTDFNTNGYTDVGDIINYTYAITNNGCNPIDLITLAAQSTVLSGGPIEDLAGGATDSTTYTGVYALTQNDINNGYVSAVANIFVNNVPTSSVTATISLNTNDGIQLVAFIDSNTNGIKDPGEANFYSGNFSYQLNNTGEVHYVGSNQPLFLYESNPSTLYDLGFEVLPAYANHFAAATSYNDVSVANASGITTYYFPITVIPFVDLEVMLWNSWAPPRPGFLYQNYLRYANNGTQTIASGTVTFEKDNLLSIIDVSQSGTTTTPTGFTYDFTNLLPGESRLIHVSLQVPTIPTVALGNTLTNVASISIPPGDINTANNTSILSQIIVGSYDPNDKTESHGGKIAHAGFGADDYLTYTIRFENTGTASAINVAVADLLDNQLEETSVRTVASSHAYTFERVGKNLSWKFNGILLPPSVENTTIGHGYVVFQVKPKPGFAIGDVIPNSADIYFDFNPAIVTEPCVTEFVNALSTADFAFSHFQFSPNPVTNTLFVSNDTTIENLTISSVLGQKVYEKPIQAMLSEVDLSVLSPGIYLVKATTKTSVKTFKIVKE